MKMSDFFKPIELTAEDKLKQKAQWAFDVLVSQAAENAYAEAVTIFTSSTTATLIPGLS